MIRFGWVDSGEGPSETAIAFLRFFGVATVDAWRQSYGNVLRSTSFRTSNAFTSEPGAVAAWLRKAELESASIRCAQWDPANFKKRLATIRKLTREKKLDTFIPMLKQYCAECGVAVAVVRAPNKCRASGAVRILARGRRLIALSFRFRSDDHFWFTFFHEAGHLLLHDEPLIVDEEDMASAKEEEEANAFAADVLIPPEYRAAMRRLPVDGWAVMRFAKEIGVSPGIVVGQLQHIGRFGPKQLNNLKRRFSFEQ